MSGILETLRRLLGHSSERVATPEPEHASEPESGPTSEPVPALASEPVHLDSSLGSVIGRLIERRVEACGADAQVLVPGPPFHGFAAAIHMAYDQHLPLMLSPDDIWLCLAQGVARHIQLNSQRLRSSFVSHAGTLTIGVRRDDFRRGAPENPWPEVFSAFSDAIRAHIGPRHEMLSPRFSTTTPTSRAATEIVLLGAMRSYLGLEVSTLCGIPEVILRGTADDWTLLRQRIASLRDLDLGWWLDALLPVLKRVEADAAGQKDPELWEHIYKPNDGSGGPYATGWINLLFPYLQENGGRLFRNPNVSKWKTDMKLAFKGGPTTQEFPGGLSCCPFVWKVLETTVPMEFYGGFVGVTRDAQTGAVAPVAGWAVTQGEGSRPDLGVGEDGRRDASVARTRRDRQRLSSPLQYTQARPNSSTQ